MPRETVSGYNVLRIIILIPPPVSPGLVTSPAYSNTIALPVRWPAIDNHCTFALETSATMQQTEHKPAKEPRIGRKIRQAVELMLQGSCDSQKAVCERLGLSESYLSRSLKKDNVQAFITRATAKTISAGKLAATATAIRLVTNARSEHVQMQASEFILGLNGYRANPTAPGLTINTGGGGVGYIICLADKDAEVYESEIGDAGGVRYGRKMTDEERRTGVLERSHPGPMIDVTANPPEDEQ
jgi:hypothetical protein